MTRIINSLSKSLLSVARRRTDIQEPRGDTAYRAIKAEIVANRLKPGALISEEQWARELRVSRTPVREALSRLEQEKLVRRVPKRGVFVADLSVDEFLDICEVRSLLEGNACHLAAQRMSEASLDKFEQEFRQLAAKQPTDEDLHRANEVDRAFHMCILETAGNQQVVAIISRLNDMITRLRFALTPSRYYESLAEHKQILAALRARDGEAAAAAMRAHLDNVSRSLHVIKPSWRQRTEATADSTLSRGRVRSQTLIDDFP